MKQDTREHLQRLRIHEAVGGKSWPERDDPSSGLLLREVLSTLRSRKWFILSMALIGTILVALIGYSLPRFYTATAQILIDPRKAGSTQNAQSISADDSLIDTHVIMLSSEALLRRTLDSMPYDPALNREGIVASALRKIKGVAASLLGRSNIPNASLDRASPVNAALASAKRSLKISQERRSRVISVSYTDKDPDSAAAFANRLSQMHVDDVQQEREQEISRSLAWIERRANDISREKEAAEKEMRDFLATYGGDAAELQVMAKRVAEARSQLSLAKADLASRLDIINKSRSEEAAPGGASSEAIRRMEDEAQLASARVSTLQRQVKALQDTIPDPAFQVTLPLLEKRITSTEQDLEALRERREDLEERGQTGTQEARIISAAWRPDYASSPSPILLLPPAFVVFGLIGSLVAVGSRHFDRKLRSERDLAEILDLPCVGTIPMLNEAGSSKHLSELIDKPNSLYAQSIRGVVGMSIGIRTSRSGRRVVLVTSDVHHEGQASLTESYVACVAQLGRKVLLVSMNRTPKLVVLHANGKASGSGASGFGAGAYPPVERIGFNHVNWDVLPLANTDADLALLLAKDATQHGLKRLFDQYDCVVIDAPSALNSIETRLMAPLSDIAMMTVYKAVTDVDQLKRTIEILKRADDLEGDRRLNFQAVLADCRPQRKRWRRTFSFKIA